MKVSVIIPVYNVEQYLNQCIDSVIAQDYDDIETILVDDGSTDSSGMICNNYREKYPEIKVIHKKNGGLSDARNTGINVATGDYILFLDGDDFWSDNDCVSTLVKRVSKTHADVLNFSFQKFFEDTKEKVPYFSKARNMPLSIKSKKGQIDFIYKNNLYISSACTKMIRRDLLDHDLFFEKGAYSEDIVWSAILLEKAKSLDFLCINFYCYRQRRDSISHSINDKKMHDLYKHIITSIKIFTNNHGDEKKLLGNYAAYQYGTFIVTQAMAEDDPNKYIVRLKKYDYILKYGRSSKKIIILQCLSSVLGYTRLCKIIRWRYKRKV